MSYYENALKMRPYIEKAAMSLNDIDAIEVPTIFPNWAVGVEYKVDDRVNYLGVLYKVLQVHTSQSDWTPTEAASLFARVLIPDEDTVPEWVQPDSTNPYMKGNKVTHNGKIWVSTIDNNVWEPSVYGWEEG
jgi:hypothetical protein